MAAVTSSRFFACFLVVLIPSMGYCNPVVNTTLGMVGGWIHQSYGYGGSANNYHVFKGIPYAEPPVGQLRFSAPVAKTPWDGVFNATRYGPSCPQDISGVALYYPDYVVKIPDEARVLSEDCLTLNVYTPANISEGSTAVMVWIHGGSFETGQGSGYDASALAVRGDVVVVTVNYRLNVFGFLCTNDENAPGNFGLLDQQLALKWVHDNIAGFGGDPSRVTLIGQSAGGASVLIHLFASNSRPLFQRVAAHSGTYNPSYSVGQAERTSKIAQEIADSAGCAFTNNENLVSCLRQLSMEELLSAALYVADEASTQIFVPVLDGNMLSSTTAHLNLKHDVMLLFTSGDGSVALGISNIVLPSKINPDIGITEDEWASFLGAILNKISGVATDNEYVDRTIEDEDLSRMKALVDMFLDWNYLSRFPGDLKAVPNVSSIHVSIFDHRSATNTRWPKLDQLVPHSEEISYLFGLPFNSSGMGSLFTDEERELSDRVIKYWSNYAKSGDPNVHPDLNSTTTAPGSDLTYWPEYGDSETYLLIGLRNSTVGEGYRHDNVMFWTDYLPSLRMEALASCFDSSDPYYSYSSSDSDNYYYDQPPCEDVFFGENLGFKLTKEQAASLIEIFMFVIIALLIVLVLILGAVFGFKFKAKHIASRTPPAADDTTKTNGSTLRDSTFEVNEGFEYEHSKM